MSLSSKNIYNITKLQKQFSLTTQSRRRLEITSSTILTKVCKALVLFLIFFASITGCQSKISDEVESNVDSSVPKLNHISNEKSSEDSTRQEPPSAGDVRAKFLQQYNAYNDVVRHKKDNAGGKTRSSIDVGEVNHGFYDDEDLLGSTSDVYSDSDDYTTYDYYEYDIDAYDDDENGADDDNTDLEGDDVAENWDVYPDHYPGEEEEGKSEQNETLDVSVDGDYLIKDETNRDGGKSAKKKNDEELDKEDILYEYYNEIYEGDEDGLEYYYDEEKNQDSKTPIKHHKQEKNVTDSGRGKKIKGMDNNKINHEQNIHTKNSKDEESSQKNTFISKILFYANNNSNNNAKSSSASSYNAIVILLIATVLTLLGVAISFILYYCVCHDHYPPLRRCYSYRAYRKSKYFKKQGGHKFSTLDGVGVGEGVGAVETSTPFVISSREGAGLMKGGGRSVSEDDYGVATVVDFLKVDQSDFPRKQMTQHFKNSKKGNSNLTINNKRMKNPSATKKENSKMMYYPIVEMNTLLCEEEDRQCRSQEHNMSSSTIGANLSETDDLLSNNSSSNSDSNNESMVDKVEVSNKHSSIVRKKSPPPPQPEP